MLSIDGASVSEAGHFGVGCMRCSWPSMHASNTINFLTSSERCQLSHVPEEYRQAYVLEVIQQQHTRNAIPNLSCFVGDLTHQTLILALFVHATAS